MGEFRVGDKVKCVDLRKYPSMGIDLELGKVYTVQKEDYDILDNHYVYVEGIPGFSINTKCFEKVEQKKGEFKVGDKVRCNRPVTEQDLYNHHIRGSASGNQEYVQGILSGKELVIEKVNDDPYGGLRFDDRKWWFKKEWFKKVEEPPKVETKAPKDFVVYYDQALEFETPEKITIEVDEENGIVTAYTEEDGKMYRGVAKCKAGEKFNELKGKHLAGARLLRKLLGVAEKRISERDYE